MLPKKNFVAVFLLLGSFLKPSAQVNLQTGSAVFSLAMFDWKDDKSRLASSIGLSYSSGNGLRVSEVASNVGQGWNLTAGGVITRMQVGEPDDQIAFSGQGLQTDQDLTKYPAGYMHPISPITNGCPVALTRYPTYGSQNTLYAQHNITAQDRQQDYFAFQFNGKSGMFVLDSSGGWHGVSLGDSRIQISLTEDQTMTSQGIRTTITSFTITDVDGLIYKFTKHGLTKLLKSIFSNADGSQPATQPSISNGGVYCQSAFDQVVANPYIITNWYLSEVDDPFTTRKILYTYNTSNLSNSAGADITYNKSSDQYIVVSYKKSITTVMDIASIAYPDGHVATFNYASGSRYDYIGEKALSSVNITYNSRPLSQYNLGTSYFILNRYGTPATPFQKNVARLCLRSVTKLGVDLKEDSPPYIFDYYTGSNNIDDFVPPPFSYAKDIWGYYNGNNSIASNSPLTGSTIPVPLNVSIPFTLGYNALKGLCFQNDNVSGTYYTAKPGYAQNGLLKEVIYPTGGSLAYTYAQNTGSFIPTPSTVLNVGGVHVSQTSSADGGYSNGCASPVVTNYNYVVNGAGSASSLWGLETPVNSLYSTNSWQEEHQTIHFSWSNPLGTCLWHYIYPGIQSQYEAISLDELQKIMVAISPVLGVLSVVSTIDDIVNVINSVGFLTVAAIALDVITAVLSYALSCPQKTKFTTTTIYYNFDLNQMAPLPAQFKRVEITESPGTIGKTVQQFTHGDPNDPGGIDYALWSSDGSNMAFSAKQRYAPWAYGLPKLTTVYDVSGNKIRETQNVYDFSQAKWELADPNTCCATTYTAVPSYKCQVLNSYSQRSDGWGDPTKYDLLYQTANSSDMRVDPYDMYTGHSELKTTYDRTYRTTDATQYVQTETDYFYNDGQSCEADNDCQPVYHNFDLSHIATHQSNGDINYKYIYYPGDYNTGVLATLVQKNMMSVPIAVQSYVVKAGGGTSYLSEKVTEYAQLSNGNLVTSRALEQRFTTPTTTITPYSGPSTTNYALYKIPQTFTYDANSNLIGIKDEGNRRVTNIYDYNDKYIVASVVNANSDSDHCAYTSFESGDLSRSGWTLSGAVSYNNNQPSATGVNNFTLLSGAANALTASSLNTATAYILSFWASNGNVSVTGGATLTKSAPAYNGFTYYEYSIAAGTTSVVVKNSAASNSNIDELRLYPVGARMRTMTYDPLIGKTSDCDENNRITYYTYDNLGRKQTIQDETHNIVKMYEYNNVSPSKQYGCPTSYSNHVLTEQVTRNNCNPGYLGSDVAYTLPAGTYSSTISQFDADIQAEIYFYTNAQNYANTNGSCSLIYYNVLKSAINTNQSCPLGYKGQAVTYMVPAHTYSSIISQADADQQALNDIAANALAYTNTPGNSTCVVDTAADWEWFPGDATGPADPSYCLSVNGSLPPHLFAFAKDVNPSSPAYNHQQYFDFGPNSACPANFYYNAQASQAFTKNNCASGYVGTSVTYTVPPGKYSSTTSQAAANQLATNDIAANGQNYANANGTCTASYTITSPNTSGLSGFTAKFTNASTGSVTTYGIPAGGGTLGTLPPGTYTVVLARTNNTTVKYLYTVCTQSHAAAVTGTFTSIVIGSSCHTVDVDTVE